MIPQMRPQRRGSRPLFFLTETNPPKNDDAYIEKNDIGVRSECGFSLVIPISENAMRSKIKITIKKK